MVESKIFRYLEANKMNIVSLTSRLIEIATLNPPGESYEEMVDFLEERCRKIGLKTRRYITPKRILDKFGIQGGSRRISLVADYSIGAKKTLHICSHYDVVPVTDKWNTDPFKAVVKGGRIYGRGSEDMKGNIACFLSAVEALKKCGVKPAVNLQLSFTPDEEIGGRTGIGYLIGKGLVKADYVMSEGHSGDAVSMGNKGVLWAEVTVKGKACHASMPHRGVNAFEKMAELVMELKSLKKRISTRKTRYKMQDRGAKGPTFVMGGMMTGGVKANVVPGLACFSIDRRLIPEEDIGKTRKEIEDVIRKFNARQNDCRATIKFSSKEKPAISLKDKAFFKVVSDSIRSVRKKSPKFFLMAGATDMRYFMWKGIPALGYSAEGGESWHSDNEFVYIDSLVDTAKVYALIMSRLR